MCGLFEWDDMIHNGLGCMVGCLVVDGGGEEVGMSKERTRFSIYRIIDNVLYMV